MGAHKQRVIEQCDQEASEPLVDPMRGDRLCLQQGQEYSWRERQREEGNQEVDRG